MDSFVHSLARVLAATRKVGVATQRAAGDERLALPHAVCRVVQVDAAFQVATASVRKLVSAGKATELLSDGLTSPDTGRPSQSPHHTCVLRLVDHPHRIRRQAAQRRYQTPAVNCYPGRTR